MIGDSNPTSPQAAPWGNIEKKTCYCAKKVHLRVARVSVRSEVRSSHERANHECCFTLIQSDLANLW